MAAWSGRAPSTSWTTRTPADHARVQQLVLERWIPSVSFAPYWREHLARVGVDPWQISDLDDLRRVPPARELALRAAGGPGGPDLVVRPTEEDIKRDAGLGTLLDVSRGIRQGGAAGRRRALMVSYKPVQLLRSGRPGGLQLAYTRSDLDRLHLAGARAALVLGLSDRDYLASAVPADDSIAFWSVHHLALAASLLAQHPRGTGEGFDRVAGAFARAPVSAVAVLRGEAVALARSLGRRADLRRVRLVVLVGAPPADEERAVIEEAWRSAGAARHLLVRSLWTPTGVRAPWAEVDLGDGRFAFATYPDLELLELLDPTGRPVEQGGGDLTYTSIGWNGTALVRYRTGEYVSGVTTVPDARPAVPYVLGPVQEAAWEPEVRNGTRLDLRGVALVMVPMREVRAWRVEVRQLRRSGADTYVVFVAGQLDATVLRELDRRLTAAVGAAPAQLVVQDDERVRADIEALGGAFADTR